MKTKVNKIQTKRLLRLTVLLHRIKHSNFNGQDLQTPNTSSDTKPFVNFKVFWLTLNTVQTQQQYTLSPSVLMQAKESI
jgi:hypothetical protein